MKVLLLHQHFNTPQKGGAIRSYYLAKALVDRGIAVSVVTAHNEGVYKTENLEGIEIHYLPVAYANNFGFYKRVYAFLFFVWKAVRLIREIPNISICYAISVPLTVGVAALWIKRKYGIPYIFEVGDLWPDAPIQMGFLENYFLIKFLYGLEKKIYNNAESVVALSSMIQAAIERKVKGKTIQIIPNMADTDYYRPEPKKHELLQKFGVEGKFVISYTGAIGVANGLDYFLDCARASQKAALPIHFLLCGEGAMLDGLKASAKRLALDNFSFIDFQNREGVREVINVSDATFVCYKNIPILETGSPNKYFDGLAAGKLIVTNFGGWIKKEIEELQLGISTNPQQPTDFVKKIIPFVSNTMVLSAAQHSARQLAERKYSRKLLSEKFSLIFK